jgi:hypothetical protein
MKLRHRLSSDFEKGRIKSQSKKVGVTGRAALMAQPCRESTFISPFHELSQDQSRLGTVKLSVN